eukprot:Ihof_evm6s65 gene=Ihof_evmTU6s65
MVQVIASTVAFISTSPINEEFLDSKSYKEAMQAQDKMSSITAMHTELITINEFHVWTPVPWEE